jgi:hypothetical protein
LRQRIELHPGTDRWMMGDMYGTIIGEFKRKGQRLYRVRMERSNKTITVHPDNIGKWL